MYALDALYGRKCSLGEKGEGLYYIRYSALYNLLVDLQCVFIFTSKYNVPKPTHAEHHHVLG